MISAFIQFTDGKVSIHSSDIQQVDTKFAKGFYFASTDSNGNLHITKTKLEELHNPYRTEENELVINTVDNFFKQEIAQKVKQLGFIHKLGILLYGLQGRGKTSVLHFIAQKLVETQYAIVFMCYNEGTLATAIRLSAQIREIQDNPIVFVADEFERYAKDAESEMKNFLDGNQSVNNSLFLAATNYLEKVPDTLKNRPSRFKVVQEIKGITDKNLMKVILGDISERINPGLFTSEEIEDIVKDIEDISMDELKHICLDKITNSYIPKKKDAKIGFLAKSKETEQVENQPPSYGIKTNWTFIIGKNPLPDVLDTSL